MQITERDEDILRHVARYRLTTSEVLRRLYFPTAKPGGEKNVLRRLTGEYLQPRPLYGKRVYYQLTPLAARTLGEGEECTLPFGPQALVRLYGTLAFCCLGRTVKPVFTRPEFLQAFPNFGDRLDLGQNHFYLDDDGRTVRLGQIIVEQGGEYLRLLNKCRRLIERGRETSGLQEMIADELFVLALVIAEESKREMLYAQLRKAPLPVWCRVEVVSGLGQLMPHPE